MIMKLEAVLFATRILLLVGISVIIPKAVF